MRRKRVHIERIVRRAPPKMQWWRDDDVLPDPDRPKMITTEVRFTRERHAEGGAHIEIHGSLRDIGTLSDATLGAAVRKACSLVAVKRG